MATAKEKRAFAKGLRKAVFDYSTKRANAEDIGPAARRRNEQLLAALGVSKSFLDDLKPRIPILRRRTPE